MMHLSSVIPANDIRERVYGHRKSQVDFAAVDDVVICWWSINSLCNSPSSLCSCNTSLSRRVGTNSFMMWLNFFLIHVKLRGIIINIRIYTDNTSARSSKP